MKPNSSLFSAQDGDSTYLGAALGAPSRRNFLAAGAALGASLVLPAFGQIKTEIHELRGLVKLNGVPVTRKTQIRPGDHLVTGSDGYIVFIIGDDAFMLRSRSELIITEREDNKALAGLLNLVTGALGAVFKRGGGNRRIHSGTITAGIRGTGVYLETRGDGTYFCTCWGAVDLASNTDSKDRELIESRNHTPRLVTHTPVDGTRFRPAPFETHTDQEMDILEKCVNRRSPILVPEWFNK